MADAELTARVSVEDAASAPLRRIEGQVESLGREMQTASATAGRSAAQWSAAFNVMAQGAQAAFSAIGAGIGHVVQTSGQLEQANIAFTTMLGSAERAQAFLQEMQQFAAQTPFQFPELVDASKRMLAFGFAAEQVRPLLTAVGNAAAALGTGAEGINRITTALGQMQAKGKVTAEEMMQLTEAGIPAWQMLADTLGTDVAGAMAAVEARTVDAATAIGAFQTGVQARFGDMMAAQARTFEGALSTLTDTAEQAAVRGFAPLFEVVTDVTVALADLAQAGAFEGWVATVEAGAAQAAAALRTIPQAAEGLNVLGTTIEQATGLGTILTGLARQAGVDWGTAFRAGILLGLGPPGLVAQEVYNRIFGTGEHNAQMRAQMVGEDFIANVVVGIQRTAPQGADAFGAVAEQLVREFEGRGFDPDTARAMAATYFDAVLTELAQKRPDMTAAGEALGASLADGLTASQGLVGAAARELAEVAGAALQQAGGNVGAAVAEALRVGMEAGFSQTALESTVALTLQQANAARALTEVLNTLTPVERARWEVLRQQTNAQSVLNQMLTEGKLTAEQYQTATERGTIATERAATQATTTTRANEALATSYTRAGAAAETAAGQLERATNASRGGFGGSGSGFRGEAPAPGTGGGAPGIPAAYWERAEQQGGGAGMGPTILPGTTAAAIREFTVEAERAGRAINGAIIQLDAGTSATKENTAAKTANTAAQQALSREQVNEAYRRMTMITQEEFFRQEEAAALARSTSQLETFTAGTGLAAQTVTLMGNNADELSRTFQGVSQTMQQTWQIMQAQAQALRSGSMLVGGLNVGPGLTHGQIYGGPAPGGGSGGGAGGSPPPGTYYGLPVVSPVTPGTLRGYADGGWITEPSYLTSMRTGQTYGMVGEAGAEHVGGGGTVQVVINASGVDALRDRQFWRRVVNEQLRYAFAEAGLVTR